MNLTQLELEILNTIKTSKRFPIVRFELRNSQESSIISTALNHVYLKNTDDEMATVKERSVAMQGLMDKGLIEINYKIFLTARSDYEIYYSSKLYSLLCEMVEEGRLREDFLFDTPFIKKGEAKLTDAGLNYKEN